MSEKKPLLSIGMIFKNEVRCLERCMKSLQPLRDAVPCELVMADTGSDDGSREIAERYADVVFDFPWINDFAAARNAVMDRCSGKWYFSIDCDEWLSEDISGVVRFLRENNAEDFGSLIIRSYMTTGLERDGNYSDFMAVRFLRMSTGLRYVGAIHERWDAQGVLRAFYLKGFILHHDGYVSRGDTRWDGKQERNMPLLREKLKENPKDLAVLQQCMESGGKTPEYKDYLYRAVKGIKEKWPGWVSFGPPVLRSAIRAAIDLKLPERDEWIAMAEEMFPDNIFTRVDVMYSVLGHVWEQQNFKESIRRANAYLEAVADYRAGRYNPVDLLTSAVTHTSTKFERNAAIVLAASYINDQQPEMCYQTLQSVDLGQTDASQTENWLRTLCQLHAKSNIDTVPMLQCLWEQALAPKNAENQEGKQAACVRFTIGLFQAAYREEEARMPDFHRYAYTVFLPLSGKWDVGTAAAILEAEEPPELERLLNLVEKWDGFPIAALEHALERGAAFPLSGRPLMLEEMDKLAGRMSGAREALAVRAAGQDLAGWQSLAWARSLALAAVQGCNWEDAARGLELSRAFAKIEGAFLPRYYAPELLEEENIRVLPPLHRFGWYCARAFAALDAGDAAGYARLLREGLSVCETMKPMAEFLTKHTPELHAPAPGEELLALAEQVRTLLASFDPSDPAVAAVKASEAYQKVAHLIEGAEACVFGGLKQ